MFTRDTNPLVLQNLSSNTVANLVSMPDVCVLGYRTNELSDREAEQCDVDASTSTGDSDGTSPSQRSSAAAVQTTEILGEPGNPQCSLASVPIDPSRIIDSTGGQNKYERLSAIRSQTPQRSILPPSYWTAVNLSTSVNGLDKFPPTVKEFVPSNQVTDTSSMQKRRPLPLARATLPPRKRMRMEETSLVPTQNMFNGPSCSVLESGTFREQPDAFASQDMTASDDLTEDFSSDSDSGSVLSNLTASSDSMVNKTDPEVPEKCDVREQGEASPRRSMLQHQQYCPVETGGERI